MRTIDLIKVDKDKKFIEADRSSQMLLPTEKEISPTDLRPKVAILTLGCKVNYSETEALAENFQRSGYVLVEPESEHSPDVFVVNTCTVTHVADKKSRQVLRRAKRENPQALVVATGCYVYTSRQQVEALPEVDLVIGKTDEERMVELVSEQLNYELPYRPEPSPLLFAGGLSMRASKVEPSLKEDGGVSGVSRAELSPTIAVGAAYRTRAMVKIQDGCNAGCAFCIVPTARGGPRSVAIAEVVEGVRHKVEEGYQEVVLTGVHLGKYRSPVVFEASPLTPSLSPRMGEGAGEQGNLTSLTRGEGAETKPVRLKALLEAILHEVNIPRLRITSLEPQDYDPTLLELWQRDKRLARHFHLALQAGSEATLLRMRRGYNLARYRSIVEQIKRELPDASITTDVIVGFPGETDQEFAETFAFAREMGFAKMHVFPYSIRAGTVAATMPNQVAEPIKKERGERLRLLSDEMSRAWRSGFVGQLRPVLWESYEPDSKRISGLTDNYIRVYAQSEQNLSNQITAVRLLSLAGEGDASGMWGEILQ